MNEKTLFDLIQREIEIEKARDKKLDFITIGDIGNSFPSINFNKIIYLQSNKTYCFFSRSYSKKVKLVITTEDEEVSLILFYGDSKIQCYTIKNKIIYDVMCYCNVERSCAIVMLLENCLDFSSVMKYYCSIV